MAYTFDHDLEFLKSCSSEDLAPLIDILIKDKDGDYRYTEGLTKSPLYQQNAPNHAAYWDLIAEEIQRFGANTIATLFRSGKGVSYREVLLDVCKKAKVKHTENAPAEAIEQALLLMVLTDSLERMSPEDLKDVIDGLGVVPTELAAPAVAAAVQAAVALGGFVPYKLAPMVANAVVRAAVGRGLALGANAALNRAIAVAAGPIGWVATGLWTAIEVAGPAHRVTFPAVIQVAYLRAKSSGGHAALVAQ